MGLLMVKRYATCDSLYIRVITKECNIHDEAQPKMGLLFVTQITCLVAWHPIAFCTPLAFMTTR